MMVCCVACVHSPAVWNVVSDDWLLHCTRHTTHDTRDHAPTCRYKAASCLPAPCSAPCSSSLTVEGRETKPRLRSRLEPEGLLDSVRGGSKMKS